MREALRLPHHPAGRTQQLAVGAVEFVPARLGLGARRPGNLQSPQFHAAAAVAQFGANCAGNPGDLLHDAGQHPHAVAQQAGVGRVVDVGLHHGGIDAHFAPLDHPFVLGDGHDSLVKLSDHLWPERHAPAAHRLGVGHLGAAHPSEVAVHQIGAHFALQRLIAPVADVLEDQ